MQIQLKQYIVAFIDLLGFSNMVRHDCENHQSQQKYVTSLYECYSETKEIKNNNKDLQLIQFSDSVVLALPYSIENYKKIIKIISDYQYSLLTKSILCRGGISHGKHFLSGDFLFSNGMIEAYLIESKQAISPRVVISKDLLSLIGDNSSNDLLLSDQDDLVFVDYLKNRNPEEVWNAIEPIISSQREESTSIKSKKIWLCEYYNHSHPNNIKNQYPKFKIPN